MFQAWQAGLAEVLVMALRMEKKLDFILCCFSSIRIQNSSTLLKFVVFATKEVLTHACHLSFDGFFCLQGLVKTLDKVRKYGHIIMYILGAAAM